MFNNKFLSSLLLLATASGCNAQNATTTAPQAAPKIALQAAPQTIAGDRHPAINCVYPPEAFFHNNKGGTVLDITKAPFGAKGDGKTDDTQAFVKAYDFVLREQDKIGYSATAMLNTNPKNFAPNPEGYPSDGPPKSNDASFIIYIPNGTYLVSDTIIYSMPDRTPSKRRDVFLRGSGTPEEKPTGWERVIWIRFVGQERDKTVIRLKDNAPGFGVGQEKAVISYGKSAFNNRKAINALRNLTVDTGRGNAGAVAVDFTGANAAQISNVTLRSSDGLGSCGLLMKRPPVIGYHSDITIEGFDYGMVSRVGHATAPVFEWVTLRGQNQAGVLLEEQGKDEGGHGQATLAMRHVRSEGAAPAARLAVDGGHLVMLDSQLNTTGNAPAVDLVQGQLFLAGVETNAKVVVETHDGKALRGRKTELTDSAQPVTKVDVYVSGQTVAGDTDTALARMAVQEAPTDLWPQSPDEWATPAQFGALADGVSDDTAAIQAALDAGKPWVFLTQGNYKTSAPLRVPATVRHINGMFRYNSKLEFTVSENGDAPLIFSDLFFSDISHDAKRPLVMDMALSQYSNTPRAAGSTVWMLNGSYPAARRNPARVNVFAWSMNNEGKGLPVVFDRTRTWVLGMKTERGPVLTAKGGSRVEIYGATIGVRPGDPAVRVEDSQLVLVANSSAGDWPSDKIAIAEVRGGKETQVKVSELPLREKGAADEKTPLRIIPFYVSGAAGQ